MIGFSFTRYCLYSVVIVPCSLGMLSLSVRVPSWLLPGTLGVVVDPLMLKLLGGLRPASEAGPWVDVFQSNLSFLS